MLLRGQGAERVVRAGKLSRELVAGLNDLLLDGVPLLLGDSWAERELRQVAANSNASGHNHSGILGSERRALEFGVVHVADMTLCKVIFVVVLDDRLEERVETVVGVLRASVDTNAGIRVLAA